MKVFVSSTYEDLHEYRARLKQYFQSLDHEPLLLPPPSDTSPKSITTAKMLIDESDVFVGMYAHLYGMLPKGEEQSLIEQEYLYAVRKGKDIACFVVDPQHKWPDKWKEDDFIKRTRLDKFLDNLRKDHPVLRFHNPDAVVRQLEPIAAKWSAVFDYIKNLRAWSEKLSANNKLSALTEISRMHQLRCISNADYITATWLIMADFPIQRSDPKAAYARPLEELLKGEIAGEAFTERLSGQSPGILASLGTWKKVSRLALVVVSAVLTGLALGYVLFASAPGSSTLDSSTGAARSAKPLSSVAATQSTGNETPPPGPDASLATTEKMSNPATSQQSALKTGNLSPAADISAQPGPGSSGITAEAPSIPATVSQPPQEKLSAGENPDQGAPASQAVETAPVAVTSPVQNPVAAVVRSTLATPDQMVVCADVNRETRQPINPADTLSGSRVWLWSRIRTNAPDDIRVRWHFNGALLSERTVRIPVASAGYRVYLSRYIAEKAVGEGRVELISATGDTLGTRRFWMVPSAPNANTASQP